MSAFADGPEVRQVHSGDYSTHSTQAFLPIALRGRSRYRHVLVHG
jgi:hypothetical protein